MNDQKEILISSKKFRDKSILAFILFVIAIASAICIWKWMHRQPEIAQVPKPLRKGLSLDQRVFSKALSNYHLAKTYPVSEAVKNVRVNGDVGLKSA